jgi:hypothetical protein
MSDKFGDQKKHMHAKEVFPHSLNPRKNLKVMEIDA